MALRSIAEPSRVCLRILQWSLCRDPSLRHSFRHPWVNIKLYLDTKQIYLQFRGIQNFSSKKKIQRNHTTNERTQNFPGMTPENEKYSG